MRIKRENLIDGDVFYFPGDGMYVYNIDISDGADWTYVFGSDVPLELGKVQANRPEVIVIHNCFDKRAELRHA